MDEESSLSGNSFDDQENDENLDKENQRRSVPNDETDEQQRFIFEQQQYQRSQFYEQQQTYRQDASPVESHDDPLMDEDLSNDLNQLVNEPVPDYLVEKIDKERWPGVNGHYDDNGIWREWNDIFSTKNDYSNEQFIILPYVCASQIDYVSLDISC